MQDLIKTIRKKMNLSQEQLAALIGISPVTVNRWENEKAKPSLMAQKQLYDICVSHKLDLADYIVEREQIHENRSVLYHASRFGISGNIQPISRSRCDFGKGFYMGTDPIQPLTLVCNEKNPVFYTLDFNTENLSVLDVEMGIDWAMLIAYYRGYMDDKTGSVVYEKYAHMADGCDVIVGYIANDRMYQVLTDFFERRITDTALIGSLSALKLGRQYVAITKKACDQIRIIKERPLQKLDLMILKDRSKIRRREGIELADRIVTEHRRDGRYFDEIVRGIEL
ncbi:MAG: DUF3990 domain-containing protein [Erysipelotrichaceae bacterium]|nr:DUF3990 domain-containing protein [Erysipelotrichaceae bacterium]